MWPFTRKPPYPSLAHDGLPYGPRERFKLVEIEHPSRGGWRAYYWHEYMQGGKWEELTLHYNLTREQAEAEVTHMRNYIRGRGADEAVKQEIEL
jgi:hypothetical protein